MMCRCQGLAIDLGVRCDKGIHLAGEAQMQMSPFMHQFAQPIALLPPLEPVLDVFDRFPFIGRIRARAAWSRPKFPFKRIEQRRDVVVELGTGEETHGGLRRIGLG